MELEELIEKLKEIPPQSEIDGSLVEGILQHYKSLRKNFPIGPHYNLKKYLCQRDLSLFRISFHIDTFDDCKAYLELSKIAYSSVDEYASVLFDAIFEREGWAEQHDEYLESAIDYLDRPCYFYHPGREHVEATTSKCQLAWWRVLIEDCGSFIGDWEKHTFKDVKNPLMIDLLYSILAEDRESDDFLFTLGHFGLLRHRTGSSPDLDEDPNRKMFEELLHGRHEYFSEVLHDLSKIESWPDFLQIVTFLRMISLCVEETKHPLHPIVMECLTGSKERANDFVGRLIASESTISEENTENVFTGSILDLIDDVEVCKKEPACIPWFSKLGDDSTFDRILEEIPMDIIADSFTFFIYTCRICKDRSPHNFLGQERAERLSQMGAFLKVPKRILDGMDRFRDIDGQIWGSDDLWD